MTTNKGIEKRFFSALISLVVSVIITIASGVLSWWLTIDLILGSNPGDSFILFLSVAGIGWPFSWLVLAMLMVYAVWKTTGLFSIFMKEMFGNSYD